MLPTGECHVELPHKNSFLVMGPVECSHISSGNFTATVAPRPTKGSIAINMSVCLFVTLCLSASISLSLEQEVSNLHQIFMFVAYGRGSVLICLRCDTLGLCRPTFGLGLMDYVKKTEHKPGGLRLIVCQLNEEV